MKRILLFTRHLTALSLLLGACLGSFSASAQSTTVLVAFQGKVTLASGDAPPDALYDIRFEIFDAPTLGINLWQETQILVPLTNGNFTVALGSSSPFPTSLFSGSPDLYLQISVDTEGNGFLDVADVQSPRTPINAVPVSLEARNANLLGGSPATDYAKQNDVVLLLSAKADVSTVYSKTEVDDQQALQDTQIAATNIALAEKADTSSLFQWQVVASGPVEMSVNRGYLVNAPSEVTLSLPAAPQLGDVVRASAAGPGGWRITQNDQQSINTSVLQIPNPSTNWVPGDSSRLWYDVASSADGSRLIAAVATGGQLYTSADFGQTWTPRESNRDWRAVASSADGTKLVAAAYSDRIYTSSDGGSTWVARDSNRSWVSVASSVDGTRLVAVAEGDQIYTSSNSGETWLARESARPWRCVASSQDGNTLIATGDNQLFVSDDGGANWTIRESFRFWRTVASSADGSTLCAAVNGGQIHVSLNGGTTWSAHETSRPWRDIVCSADGTRIVAVTFPGKIYISDNSGQTWRALESDRDWFSVASSADGNRLIAGVYPGNLYTFASNLEETTPGLTGGISAGANTAVELQYIGNNKFMPISTVGAIDIF